MASSKLVQRKDHIFELLRDKNSAKPIVLVGDSGVGKTWTARQISNCAVKEGLFEFAVWVFLDIEFDGDALHDRVAHQLSIRSAVDEWDPEDGIDEADNHKTSQHSISDFSKGKRFLLILDSCRNDTDEKDVLSKLINLLNLPNESSFKVIITSAKSIDSYAPTEYESVMLEPLSLEESRALLRERVGDGVMSKLLSVEESRALLQEKVGDDEPSISDLAEKFMENRKYLPRSIILMAKAIRYFSLQDSGPQMIKSALEQASGDKSYDIKQLLESGYDGLPRNVLIDCCRRWSDFSRSRGSIHYNELIAHWILEGYFGHVDWIEVAYEKGHSVLMELVDCQVLKNLEGGYVTMDRAISNKDEYNCYGGRASLGLADVLADLEWEGFGRITWTDGMIKSLRSGKKERKLSTVFLSGNRCVEFLYDDSVGSKQEIGILAFFNPTFNSLAHLLSDMHKLFVLVLRGCEFLENIDHKFNFKRLTVLEISNASSLKTIPNDFFDHVLQLRSLHISELKVLKVLRSFMSYHYRIVLKKLTCIEAFEGLQELDLSGTKSLVEIEEFSRLTSLQILNLSETSITALPSLSKACGIRKLLLSGCSSLTAITDASFDKLTSLEHLDLSGTMIESLPCLSLSTVLSVLSLKDCSKLSSLPPLQHLTNLQELNLCGVAALDETRADFLEGMSQIRILNLSKTGIKELKSMSNLTSLKKLFLRGCKKLQTVQNLGELTALEVLDLSESGVTQLPPLGNFRKLRQLLLGDRSRLEGFPVGMTVGDLPNRISELTDLEYLHLPNTNNVQGSESRNTTSQQEEVDPKQWAIFRFPDETPGVSERPPISYSGIQFLQSSKENPTSLEETLRRFHFCIHPTEAQPNNGHTHRCRNDFIFRDIRFPVAEFGRFKEKKSLEIHGFNFFPTGIEDVLCNADCVFFIDDTFKLSGINAASLKEMKGCWIERCTEMESFLNAREEDDATKPGIALEELGISNAINLHTILSGTLPRRFENLKSLYLDCCPKLSNVFSASSLPENLKVLQIKFCDNLENMFTTSQEPELRHLETLCLWELPELKRIGCRLPSLHTLKVWECPKLQKLDYSIHSVQKLQSLWISNVVDLKSICSGSHQPGGLSNLETLVVECCPMLENVFSTPETPQSLKTLKIKSCNRLKTVFEHDASSDRTLHELQTLHLYELPKLEKIGGRLLAVENRVIMGCPNFRDSPVV
ncbi:putative disease resistance protein At4g19050 isoform X2 [Rhododendron vialii]|uniref:putative disease resistance protein At4g19050 isoform X2 n=1 Tax=Rhododendron vialii TaxID=182163 RepID=UPI00265DBFD9|nr:putative disease resistance protein At4g19050 isoform X2 [Rhododendron vialii]